MTNETIEEEKFEVADITAAFAFQFDVSLRDQ